MSKNVSIRTYLVPLVDVNWVNFAPMDPEKNYMADAPPVEQCAREIEKFVDEMRNLTDGRVVFAIHSGTYCRKAFYEEPFLSHYRRALAAGGELCIHTHEEIAGQGTRNAEQVHMAAIIRDRKADLKVAGLRANSYRGGHFAYLDYLTPLLEREQLYIDFSSAPGFNKPAWDAVWVGAPFSAHYLCRDQHTSAHCDNARSSVLEIPLGCDGLGTHTTNYLYNEESTDEDLRRVWDTVAKRADQTGTPQFIHSLYHSSSMGIPTYLERFRRFIDYAGRNGAVFVNPSEAKGAFDEMGIATASA